MSRQVLAELQEFDPYSIARYISTKNLNFVTAADFESFFRQRQIFVKESECHMIVKAFDTFKQRSLNEEELLSCLLPRHNFQKKDEVLHRSPSRSPTKRKRLSDIHEDEAETFESPEKSNAGNNSVYLELPYAVEIGVSRILQKELEL